MKKKIGLLVLCASLLILSCKKVDRPNGEISSENNVNATTDAVQVVDGVSTEKPKETIQTNPTGTFANMTFNKTVHDFGKIKADSKVETTFEFVNNGKADLLITNATGSCGCTVPDYPKTPIKVGGKGIIKVSFDSTKKTGLQSKSVTITANTPNGMEVLEVKSDVLPNK